MCKEKVVGNLVGLYSRKLNSSLPGRNPHPDI